VASETGPTPFNQTAKINAWKTILGARTMHYGKGIAARS
jgi:hypothetical protein